MNPWDDILKYFSESADDQQRKAIEKNIEDNESEMNDLAMLKTIWEEVESLTDFSTIDTDQAWKTVELKIDPDAEARRFSIWPYISVAASIALLVMSGLYFLNKDTSYYVEIRTGVDEYQQITLADGSTVILRENSYLKYPKSFDNETERRIWLRGDAQMTIAENAAKPFITQNYGADILAVGTAYILDSDSSATSQESILENVGGQMSITSRADTSISVLLSKKGDRAIFDGNTIEFIPVEPPPPPPQDTLSHDMPIGTIINELQYLFQRNFIVSSQMPYSSGSIVKVNLGQDLLSIMAQLDTIADVDYTIAGNTLTLLRLLPKRDD